MESSALLTVVVWIAPIILSISTLMLIADTHRHRLPPGPWRIPIIGSFHAITWTHRSLARLAERYGPLMSFWLGHVPTIVVSTPDAAREILQNVNLDGRPVLDVWHAEGHSANSVIVLPPHDKWRAMRRFSTTELFTQRQLDARASLRQETTHELVRHVSQTAARGETVNVRHVAFEAAMDLLTRTLFSVNIPSHELRHFVKEASLVAWTPTISDFIPALAAADLQGVRRRIGALIRYAHGIIDEQFMRRRRARDAGETRKDDMMDVVIDKEEEWKQERSHMNYDAVKGLFTDFFAAGTDTVSTTVEWAMAELLRCPESMNKVKNELNRVISTKRGVEESDIRQLPYLQAVVKETLRLHPTVPLSFHQAMETVQIRDYTIPKGSTIILNIWAVHRNGDTWMNPDNFVPERFIGNNISFWGKDFELIPFGAGRRICLGLPQAHRMIHLMLGSLLYHFDWMLPPETIENGIEVTEKFGTVVSLATPLKVIPKECNL